MRAVINVLASTLFACAALAQPAPSQKVVFPLIVEDSSHQAVTGLTRESLAISEHKTSITEFKLVQAANLPLQLGIVIDTSKSEHSYDLEKFVIATGDFAKNAMHFS
jgi:hypothetical protein